LISVLLFAIITQVLEAIGAISLTTTQQVTIWLVAGVLIVLLLIADMACRAYLTAKTYGPGEQPPTPANGSGVTDLKPTVLGPHEPPQPVQADGSDVRAPVPPKNGNTGDNASARQNSPRLPVKMADVFPQGCYLVPGSFTETYDYDEKTKTWRPSIDKITGHRIYQCKVVDMDPELNGRSRETVVKIVAGQTPVPPTQAPYESVDFERLTAIPYRTNGGRAAYTSLCATGIRQAIIAGT
jgi:hypothetical protein